MKVFIVVLVHGDDVEYPDDNVEVMEVYATDELAQKAINSQDKLEQGYYLIEERDVITE